MNSDKFKDIRKRCELSQVKLSEILGVNQAQISRWERGLQPIPKWVDKLVDCLKNTALTNFCCRGDQAYVPHFEEEPMPHYNCNHRFVPIKPRIKFWASDETKMGAPDHAPVKIKYRCELCGGVEWFY